LKSKGINEKVKWDGYPHVLKSQQFDKKWVEDVLFPLANKIEKLFGRKKLRKLLKGKTMASVFASESTRTRASHEIGFTHLGGKVAFSSQNANLSGAMGKGESFKDTLKVFDSYNLDLIVARNDSLKETPIIDIAKGLNTPIINAGDGAGKDKQHPTQALLDLYTIYKHLGKIKGLNIAMIGDLKNGRTVRSLCYLLAKWNINHIYFVAPKALKIGKDILAYLKSKDIKFSEHRNLKTIASKIDVFYQTRTQTNLGSRKDTRLNNLEDITIIDKEILKLGKKTSIIMHPLPCLDEIVRSEVDNDPRAIYINNSNNLPSQLKCGLIIRIALMLLIIAPHKSVKLLG